MRGAPSWARRARDFTYYFGLLPPGRHGWHVPRILRDARAYRRASAHATAKYACELFEFAKP